MEFLNKPMSEVWKATKRTFNEIMEINNSDLTAAASPKNQEDGQSCMDTPTVSATTAIHIPQNSSQTRYKNQGKTTSLPRLQRPPSQPQDIRDYDHVGRINSSDGNDEEDDSDDVGESSSWGTVMTVDNNHVSRSRSPDSNSDHSVSMQPRNRYRSNSSDRASMRNRNEEAMVNRYHRSTSYDKAMDNIEDEGEEEEEDQSDKMKTKLMSMWNNMKYGWTVKSKTAFSLQKPIWFLGKCYQHRPSDPEPVLHPGMETVKSPQMELFKQDFTSRIWMTYRREFPQLEGSTLTTDCGWGCMLRSGQMLMAQCLVTHFLGRDWNVYKEQSEEMDKFHHEIIRWFGDQPSDMSPFSVHRLVSIGQKSGKKAGDWYGPASVAHIFRDAMETAPELNPLFEQVCVYVAQDCTVYKQDVIDQCCNRYQGSPKPVYKDSPFTYTNQHTQDGFHNSQHSNTSQSPNQQISRETVINGHCRDETKYNASGPSHNAPSDKRRLPSDTDCSNVIKPRNPSTSSQSNYPSHNPPSDKRRLPSDTDCSNVIKSRNPSTSSQSNYPSHNPPSDKRRLPSDTDCSNVIKPRNPSTSSQSNYPADSSKRTISHNTFGHSSLNGTEYTCTSNPAYNRQSSSGNQTSQGASQCVNRTKSDGNVHLARDNTEHLICRRNAVKESKQGSAYAGLWSKNSAGFKSRKADNNWECALPPDYESCYEQDLEKLEYMAQPQSHNSSVKEPIWRRQSADHGTPVDVGMHRQTSKEAEINGHSMRTDKIQEKPSKIDNKETKDESKENKWCALILLVPVRLGGDEVNPIYITPLRSLFTLDSCMGIIGGKPKHSLYYVGFQDEKLIHLDPHYCQAVVDMKSRKFPTYSFHCMSPRKMRITNMDPSCTVGFYLKTEEEFDEFCQTISEVVTPSKSSGDYPMFIVREGHCTDWQDSPNDMDTKKDRFLRIRHIDQDGRLLAPMKESEDFVFLES